MEKENGIKLTVIQELIEVLEKNKCSFIGNDAISTAIRTGFANAILCAKDKLEKEKQQIIATWNAAGGNDGDRHQTGSDYFNRTFKQ